MKTIAQQPKPTARTRAAADVTSRRKGNDESTFQFEDRRPSVAVQRNLHVLMNGSAAVRRGKTPTQQRKQSPVQRQIVDEETMQSKEKRSSVPHQQAAVQMKAGVESFNVRWSKYAGSNANVAKLRLDYTAKFKKDEEHKPEDADFRQNACTVRTITDGTHKGNSFDSRPIHDDNYSRADDTAGNTYSDVDFVSHDIPGPSGLAADDVMDYTFTAEQMIIDTSDGNKVIAKRGPHSATITGEHPRTWDPALPFDAT